MFRLKCAIFREYRVAGLKAFASDKLLHSRFHGLGPDPLCGFRKALETKKLSQSRSLTLETATIKSLICISRVCYVINVLLILNIRLKKMYKLNILYIIEINNETITGCRSL